MPLVHFHPILDAPQLVNINLLFFAVILQSDGEASPTLSITNHRIFKGHSACIRAFAFNSCNARSNLQSVATVSNDGSCRAWPLNSSSGEILETIATFHSHTNDAITVDYKNDVIASGGKDTKVVIYDTAPINLKGKGESTNVAVANFSNQSVAKCVIVRSVKNKFHSVFDHVLSCQMMRHLS